jgi:outer membrane protein assembly factor BamB
MEEIQSQDFDEFCVEMGEYEVVQTTQFDRFLKIETGGSIETIPLIVDSKVYFGCMNHNLYAVDANTGKEVWRFRTQERIGASAPVHHNGRIFFGSHDYNFYALDAKTGELLWKFKMEGSTTSPSSVYNETVYVGSIDRNLYALNACDGTLKWKFETRDRISSRPTIHEGKVFLGSYDRNLYCLDAETGRLLWKFGTQGEVHSLNPFVIHKGVIYFGSFDNILRAVRLDDRALLWKVQVGSYGLSAQPVLDGGVLYQGTRDGDVIAISLEGRVLWRFKTNEVVHIPAVEGDRIFFGSGDHNFYCLDKHTGKEIWRFHTDGPNYIGPTVWQGKVFFGSFDCHLYVLNTGDGSLAWKFRVEGEPSRIPPPYEGFEVRMKIPGSEFKEREIKRYDGGIAEEGEEVGSFYKSRVTYQVSTQYASKGKYQVDSDEEAL